MRRDTILMTSLYNPVPYPPNTRRCFWDAAYVASQSFCKSSKLTEREAQLLADFEEMKYWERNEAMKTELSIQARFESDETVEEMKQDYVLEIAKNAILEFGFCNTQTSGSLLPKNTLNRSDFLNR